MGTARMAADPGEGVCATDGAVSGVAGLYVADASLFPTAVGVNPMMTIIAFSKRVASGIARTAPGGVSTEALRQPPASLSYRRPLEVERRRWRRRLLLRRWRRCSAPARRRRRWRLHRLFGAGGPCGGCR